MEAATTFNVGPRGSTEEINVAVTFLIGQRPNLDMHTYEAETRPDKTAEGRGSATFTAEGQRRQRAWRRSGDGDEGRREDHDGHPVQRADRALTRGAGRRAESFELLALHGPRRPICAAAALPSGHSSTVLRERSAKGRVVCIACPRLAHTCALLPPEARLRLRALTSKSGGCAAAIFQLRQLGAAGH
jgi:hypothetical protein